MSGVPYFAAADLAAFMADAPSLITVAGVAVKCWRRQTESPIGPPQYEGQEVFGRTVEVTLLTGALPGLALDAVATLDGVSYQVRDFQQIGDGAFTKLYLGQADT